MAFYTAQHSSNGIQVPTDHRGGRRSSLTGKFSTYDMQLEVNSTTNGVGGEDYEALLRKEIQDEGFDFYTNNEFLITKEEGSNGTCLFAWDKKNN